MLHTNGTQDINDVRRFGVTSNNAAALRRLLLRWYDMAECSIYILCFVLNITNNVIILLYAIECVTRKYPIIEM